MYNMSFEFLATEVTYRFGNEKKHVAYNSP